MTSFFVPVSVAKLVWFNILNTLFTVPSWQIVLVCSLFLCPNHCLVKLMEMTLFQCVCVCVCVCVLQAMIQETFLVLGTHSDFPFSTQSSDK